eukprot:gene13619-19496_t
MASVRRQLLPSGSPLLSDELRQQANAIWAYMRETHPKLSSDTDRIFEYARFLLLKAYMEDASMPPMLAPSGIVDEVWHAHMLRPHLYMRLCEELGMGVIAHDPDTALDIDNHNKRLAKTTKLYAVMFEEEAGSLWREDAGHEAALLPAGKLEAGNATTRGDATTSRLHGRVSKTSQTKMNVCGGEELVFSVKMLTGTTYNVHAHTASTIDMIKRRVQVVGGIPSDQQRLIFKGKHLEDGRTLADYNVVNGSMVHLVLRQGGC